MNLGNASRYEPKLGWLHLIGKKLRPSQRFKECRFGVCGQGFTEACVVSFTVVISVVQ